MLRSLFHEQLREVASFKMGKVSCSLAVNGSDRSEVCDQKEAKGALLGDCLIDLKDFLLSKIICDRLKLMLA